LAQDDNNNTSNSNNSDDLYKVSAEEDRHAGLRAIEPLPGSLSLVIIRFDKAPIKVDLPEKEQAAKLKTQANDWGICDERMNFCKENSEGYEDLLVKLATIFGKHTLCYEDREYRQLIGWDEYLVDDNIRRYVPICDGADRIRTIQFCKKNLDGSLE
jgi:hypothetical protein